MIKYLKGNIFFKAYSSSAGEVIGKLSVIFLIRCMSLKRILLLGYCISSISVLLLIICADKEQLMPWLIGFARIGIGQQFVALYLSLVLCMPTILVSTAFGTSVTVGKISTIFAPLIAEADSPINLFLMLAIITVAGVVSQCLNAEKYAD